jgi:predicted small lipoprotein YifL
MRNVFSVIFAAFLFLSVIGCGPKAAVVGDTDDVAVDTSVEVEDVQTAEDAQLVDDVPELSGEVTSVN